MRKYITYNPQNFFLYYTRIIFCIIIIITLNYCSKRTSETDIIEIGNVNSYITKKEIRRGIKKSYNSMSSVTMSHEKHEEEDVSCIVCHHHKKKNNKNASNSSRIKKCVFCHKGQRGSRILHEFCTDCHIEKEKGPVKCDECHKEEKVFFADDKIKKQYEKSVDCSVQFRDVHTKKKIYCVYCHHDSTKSTDKSEYKKCGSCHTGVSEMKILHVFCKNCHKKKIQGKNIGPVHCYECHKSAEKIKVDDIIILEKTGHQKPSIKFNHAGHAEEYTSECIECHHKMTNKKCSYCHKRKDIGNVINIKGAFHQQCHNCHRESSGPKACSLCHVIDKKKGRK